eukprot:s243_g18.t1
MSFFPRCMAIPFPSRRLRMFPARLEEPFDGCRLLVALGRMDVRVGCVDSNRDSLGLRTDRGRRVIQFSEIFLLYEICSATWRAGSTRPCLSIGSQRTMRWTIHLQIS